MHGWGLYGLPGRFVNKGGRCKRGGAGIRSFALLSPAPGGSDAQVALRHAQEKAPGTASQKQRARRNKRCQDSDRAWERPNALGHATRLSDEPPQKTLSLLSYSNVPALRRTARTTMVRAVTGSAAISALPKAREGRRACRLRSPGPSRGPCRGRRACPRCSPALRG